MNLCFYSRDIELWLLFPHLRADAGSPRVKAGDDTRPRGPLSHFEE
jgi:hypothetical protein